MSFDGQFMEYQLTLTYLYLINEINLIVFVYFI